MNKLIPFVTFALLCLVASSSASAAATVTYVNPDKMTDVPRDKRDREKMEEDLLEHFNKLAAKLPAGQELKVEIFDIDLAGDVFPRVAIQNVRVFRGRGDFPHIHMRYRIEQDGKLISSGERELTDMAYMMGFNRYRDDLFGHEKQLLDDWFRKDVVAAR
jgi:hypothetical protein